MTRRVRTLAALAIVAVAASSCGGDPSGSGQNKGGDAKNVVVGVDLPFTGQSKDASDDTWDAMQLYLEQVNKKAGKHTVELKKYDDATATAGQWDPAKCKLNAEEHVNNAAEVAVMGTYNSGCAKIEAPLLNQAPGSPMLMVSHANTNPGLTKKWDPGEPEKFFPNGKRNYARVITTDDFQGQAAANYAYKDLGLKKCFVLNDNQTYGQGVANAFRDEAKKLGIEIVGEQAWDGKQPNYTALFTAIKGKNPDCVYAGGIYDNNGGQLVKDKVTVLGPNDGAVKLFAADGFTGYPEFQNLPQAAGAYMTFAGLDTSTLKAAGGAAAKFLTDYNTKYGRDPRTSYALYGVAALQAILAAIEKSDGTRKGVRDAVFEGTGVSISSNTCMLGKELKIDPASGDASARDITVLIMKDKKETFVKAQPVI